MWSIQNGSIAQHSWGVSSMLTTKLPLMIMQEWCVPGANRPCSSRLVCMCCNDMVHYHTSRPQCRKLGTQSFKKWTFRVSFGKKNVNFKFWDSTYIFLIHEKEGQSQQKQSFFERYCPSKRGVYITGLQNPYVAKFEAISMIWSSFRLCYIGVVNVP